LPAVRALTLGFCALPTVTMAQQWDFSPLVEVGAQYIDNPRLIEGVDDTNAISGGLLDLGAEMRRNTETASVLFRPSAAIYRYPGDSEEDSEAYRADFSAEKLGQRSQWRFDANYDQDQVFHGETTPSDVDDGGIDDDVQTGTGRTFERRQRDLWRVAPGATFEFTERTALGLDFNYLDVAYDSQNLGEAVDYTNMRADIEIVRTLSPNSTLEFGVFGSRYEPDVSDLLETDSVGVRARYETEVSNVSTFFIDVGAQDSKIDNPALPGGEFSDNSFLWNIGYIRQFEVTRWYFDLGQNVTPSGSGVMVERDLYRAIMTHQFQPRWSLQLAAVAMKTTSIGDRNVINVNDRDYAQGEAALAWQMTRNWTIDTRYIFTHQDFSDIEGDAQKHEVRLSFIYRPLGSTE
jgi:hypothetical protein